MKLILFLTIFLSAYVNASSCDGKKFHLTFDDGPRIIDRNGNVSSDAPTPKIKRALKKTGVKATFFVNSHLVNTGQVDVSNKSDNGLYSDQPFIKEGTLSRREANRNFLKELYEDGHKIASHGFYHYSFKSNDPAYPGGSLNNDRAKENNIRYSTDILSEFMDDDPYFRFPYGKPFPGADTQMRADVLGELQDQGYLGQVGWNYDSRDWEAERGYTSRSSRQRSDFIRETIEAFCSGVGGIAVFHDDKFITADSIEEIIEGIKERGGKFVDFKEISEYLREQSSTHCSEIEFLGKNTGYCSNQNLELPKKCKSQLDNLVETILSRTNNMSSPVFDGYEEDRGSFLTFSYALETVNTEFEKGNECLIQPFVPESGEHAGKTFYRVRCKESRMYSYDQPHGSFLEAQSVQNKLIEEALKGNPCITEKAVVNSKEYTRVKCQH